MTETRQQSRMKECRTPPEERSIGSSEVLLSQSKEKLGKAIEGLSIIGDAYSLKEKTRKKRRGVFSSRKQLQKSRIYKQRLEQIREECMLFPSTQRDMLRSDEFRSIPEVEHEHSVGRDEEGFESEDKGVWDLN